MQISPKYHIHAEIRTSGVVERSDVVGAIFGQTEGLLGDELDLRDLQESSKIGRIDVSVDSEGGRSFGTITITSGLDRVKTAVLAAALETIERVGPCHADCTVTEIEDARAAKRRELVDRATQLLAEIEEETMTSESLIDSVRQHARVEDITEFEGLPAGPRVADSDAIILVEGRADVRRLLRFGVKNAIGVEGTDIPDPVARLSRDRTTTAFLDGDRGGDLILRELEQVGDVDYVAFAPSSRSVEDLDRSAILNALRKKVPYDQTLDADSPREAFAPREVETTLGENADTQEDTPVDDTESEGQPDETEEQPMVSEGHPADGDTDPTVDDDGGEPTVTPPPGDGDESEHTETERESSADGGLTQAAAGSATADSTDQPASPADPEVPQAGDTDDQSENTATDTPRTLNGHVEATIEAESGQARLLDDEFQILTETAATDAFDAVVDAEDPPHTVVVDGTITQRLLDVAAQRGVGQVIGGDAGEFVKQPASVRVQTADGRP